MVVGHGQIRSALQDGLPPVALFIGPRSVGKWTTAESLRVAHDISAADLLRVNTVTADSARAIVQFASMAAVGDAGRLVIARLSGATPSALHIMLKALEEPSATKFILITDAEVLPTIRTRSQVFEFSLLSASEVSEILVSKKKFKTSEADRLAALSGGQVNKALDAIKMLESKEGVVAVLKAMATNSPTILDELAKNWTDDHTKLLEVWCREAISTRWRLFSEEDTTITGKSFPLRVLMALRADIRPRLVVRASLMSVLRGA